MTMALPSSSSALSACRLPVCLKQIPQAAPALRLEEGNCLHTDKAMHIGAGMTKCIKDLRESLQQGDNPLRTDQNSFAANQVLRIAEHLSNTSAAKATRR